ncbi:MAG: LytR C-terminal domain-containing protein [Acidimicrobiales bacterium]|nr:LytR C-terminal domain-containing protein [Acidimicrobiales bacterium]
MTAPEARSGGLDGSARGLVVLVVALVVGFLLLLNAGGGGASTEAATDSGGEGPTTTAPLDSDPTTTVASTTPTTEASTRSPSEVKVVVLNGSGPTGAAADTSDTIAGSGYEMGTPANGTPIETTTVYFTDGFEAEATAVALLLGKSPDNVAPIADASLNGAEGDADVVVLLGADTPPVSEGSSTTTTAAN